MYLCVTQTKVCLGAYCGQFSIVCPVIEGEECLSGFKLALQIRVKVAGSRP